jgi:NADPH-dependent curcumin reductase CurA
MHRGGLGAIYEIELLENAAEAFIFAERGKFAPAGVAGGKPAAKNVFRWRSHLVSTAGDAKAGKGGKAGVWHVPPGISKMVGIKLQRGDRVLVSGAAGGVGSSVTQIAKHHGASRVVGIAGSAEKCRMLVERLGYDAAIDYRSEDLQTRLGELLPEGFDVMFDNVGGETLDTALLHLRMDARVVLCGRISEYLDDEEQPYALRNYQRLHKRYASLRGFFIYRLESMFPQAESAMAEMIHAGALTHAEDVLEGLERMPEALIRLYSGANRGKQLVRVDPQAETYRHQNPWMTV